eukprot:GHRQ01011289.1.p1 GENE.GHRQ01011289.1~~GHRQ01011289.1.p1  ORF type:complete len:348 (+),score=106.08 GHRQ01011289.1:464-1507(+)
MGAHAVAHALPSSADLGLYILRKKDGSIIYLLVYVDDILFASSSLAFIQELKAALAAEFDARDLGEPSQFLSISIQRSSSGIKLSQPRMIADLLTKFNLSDGKPKSAPITKGALDVEGSALDIAKYPYSTLVGSLLYIAMCTRPDIAHAVGVLSRHLSNPTTTHWSVAEGVLRYLAGTKDYSLCYSSSSSKSNLLHGDCDSDWASDLETSRSTTGYLFKLAGAAILRSSKRQPTVATSTAEAEYIAASFAAREAAWLRELLCDLGIATSTVPIGTDNQSSLALLNNVTSSNRTKHIDIAYHYARECVELKKIAFSYVPTGKMVADLLTKPVPQPVVQYCRQGMGLSI